MQFIYFLQVVLTRGKKRHIYDINMDIKFEVQHNSKNYPGHIVFNDMSPGNHDGTVSFKKSLPPGADREIRQCANGLLEVITKRIEAFDSEYKAL